MNKMKTGILMAFVLGSMVCSAQPKTEREMRIARDEVPQSALNWFYEVFPTSAKVKWYAEETSGKQSFEAKLNHDGQKFSVEFSESGEIEDIESEINWKEMPEELQQNLTQFFEQYFKRHSIRKVQRQWTGSEGALKTAISQNSASEITTRYEIEFYGVDDDRKALWEGLFTEDGELIEKREVILRPTDNLNY